MNKVQLFAAKSVHSIRLLIVSDNQLVVVGIRMILDGQLNIAIVGEAHSSGSAVEMATREQPEVIILDLDLVTTNILTLVEELKKAAEASLVLLLSSLKDGEIAQKALCSGAAGIILKVQPPAVLLSTIESLCETEAQDTQKLMDSPTLVKFLSSFKKEDVKRSRILNLTTREREIVCLIANGLKNKDIADRLCISEITVRHHLTAIFSKLEVANRQKLIIFAHQHQLVELTANSDFT